MAVEFQLLPKSSTTYLADIWPNVQVRLVYVFYQISAICRLFDIKYIESSTVTVFRHNIKQNSHNIGGTTVTVGFPPSVVLLLFWALLVP